MGQEFKDDSLAGEKDYSLPTVPTSCLAGSREKVEVMRKRIEARQAAFHPMDSKYSELPGFEGNCRPHCVPGNPG